MPKDQDLLDALYRSRDIQLQRIQNISQQINWVNLSSIIFLLVFIGITLGEDFIPSDWEDAMTQLNEWNRDYDDLSLQLGNVCYEDFNRFSQLENTPRLASNFGFYDCCIFIGDTLQDYSEDMNAQERTGQKKQKTEQNELPNANLRDSDRLRNLFYEYLDTKLQLRHPSLVNQLDSIQIYCQELSVNLQRNQNGLLDTYAKIQIYINLPTYPDSLSKQDSLILNDLRLRLPDQLGGLKSNYESLKDTLYRLATERPFLRTIGENVLFDTLSLQSVLLDTSLLNTPQTLESQIDSTQLTQLKAELNAKIPSLDTMVQRLGERRDTLKNQALIQNWLQLRNLGRERFLDWKLIAYRKLREGTIVRKWQEALGKLRPIDYERMMKHLRDSMSTDVGFEKMRQSINFYIKNKTDQDKQGVPERIETEIFGFKFNLSREVIALLLLLMPLLTAIGFVGIRFINFERRAAELIVIELDKEIEAEFSKDTNKGQLARSNLYFDDDDFFKRGIKATQGWWANFERNLVDFYLENPEFYRNLGQNFAIMLLLLYLLLSKWKNLILYNQSYLFWGIVILILSGVLFSLPLKRLLFTPYYVQLRKKLRPSTESPEG